MNGDPGKSAGRETRLDEVIAEYLEDVDLGRAPSREQFLAVYPDLADDLAEFLDNREQFQHFVGPMAEAANLATITCPQCLSQIETGAGATTCGSCGWRLRPNQTADPFPIPHRVGRIELTAVVGRGAFGTVYKGWDADMRRDVAVKVLRKDPLAAPDQLPRFLQDSKITAQLNHPGIVKVHDVGESEGIPYLISEFVPGRTLASLIRDDRPIPDRAATLVAAVADALEHAHRKGVIHRDVKPANILLKDDREPLLTDFGLALWDTGDVTLTEDGRIIGTLAYMSPEQAHGDGHNVDGRSDVYSLGMVLYELLTGERPFAGNVKGILYQIEYDEPRPPRVLDDRIPRDLQTICLKCLQKVPRQRYESAKELADDLRRYLNRKPILARPVSNLERVIRWGWRNPALAAAIGLAVVFLVATTAVSVAWAIHAGRQSDAIHKALDKSKLQLAENYLDRGLMHAERGEVGTGLLWLTRSLETLPAGSAEFEWTIRANLAGWRGQLLALTDCQTAPGRVLGFAPDGHTIWFVNEDARTISRWDSVTQKIIGPTLNHPAPVLVLGQSADGKRVVTGCDGPKQPVRLWNTATGELERIWETEGKVSGAAFSADGRKVLIATITTMKDRKQSTKILLRDVNSGQLLGQPFVCPGPVQGLALSPDGQTLLTIYSREKAVRFWEVSGGRSLGVAFQHPGVVLTVSFSANGRTVVTGSEDRTARVWDVDSGLQLAVVYHSEPVWVANFDREAVALRAANKGSAVRIWNGTASVEPMQMLPHPDKVRALALSHDGKRIATGCDDGHVYIWDTTVNPWRQVGAPLAHPSHIAAVAFNPEGNQLAATMHMSPQVWLWDLASRQVQQLPHGHPVRRVVFSPNGKLLASTGYDNKTILWDPATGRQSAAGALMHNDDVHGAAFSPDGTMIVTVGNDKMARRWNTATGTELDPPLKHQGVVRAVSFSPDGLMILTGSDDGNSRWDTFTGQLLGRAFEHGRRVSWVGFDPNGKIAATASDDQTVRIWDAATGERKTLLFGHAGRILSVAIHSDGQWGITTSEDRTARLWSFHTGRTIGPPFRHTAEPHAVILSRDGQWFVTAAREQSVRVWSAPAVRQDSISQLILWSQVATGTELDPDGGFRVLDPIAWKERRQMFRDAGGE